MSLSLIFKGKGGVWGILVNVITVQDVLIFILIFLQVVVY